MKSSIALSIFSCLALGTLVMAVPTPVEPIFVSRMVRRQEPAAGQRLATFCGEFALDEPQKLEVRSYNDSATAYLGITPSDSGTLDLTTSPEAALFEFQTCNTQGFTQGYTRNTGGSMGAPLEFWGRVVTNVTEANATSPHSICLSASSAPPETKGSFSLQSCNDSDPLQWFRLQEAIGAPTVTYFPLKNDSSFKYTGQTPAHFSVDLHPEASVKPVVQYTAEDSEQYVLFDQ